MTNPQASLKRTEVRKILGRHLGSKGEIARALGVRPQSVSSWLGGRTKSARIAAAANAKAQALLKLEAQQVKDAAA